MNSRAAAPIRSLIFGCFSLCLLMVDTASACPRVAGLPDVSCDGALTVVTIGDSVTAGVGDDKQGGGGYPRRLRDYLDAAQVPSTVSVLAQPGATCATIWARLRNAYENNYRGVHGADYAIFSCGLNDFFTTRDPAKVYAINRRAQRFLRAHGTFAVVATLTPTRRDAQGRFIAEVNRRLRRLHDVVRFDELDTSQEIGSDSLHPNGSGYDKLFEAARDSLTGIYTEQAERRLGLVDHDKDGLYDYFERTRFHTDPRSIDTDQDGLSDGKEVFKYFTNPLRRDTDRDGFDDASEVIAGSDPLDPASRP